ncbi:MAG: hypothetical protein JRJ56_01190 [Deltaproteobacteria bacterium]|nr:hypothetical protein [Deltaproteobacteria bacterium]
MGRETELDDLELEKLLEDDDFLEDFDVDELAEDLLVDDSPPAAGETVDPEAVPAAAAASAPTAPAEPAAAKPAAAPSSRPRRRLLLPLLLALLVMLLLAPQVYFAARLVQRRPVIRSQVLPVTPPVMTSPASLPAAEDADLPAKAAAPALEDITTFSFFYPLYSLEGLQVLGVDIRLIFSPPPGSVFTLSREQVAQLQAEIIAALDDFIGGRLLEEIRQPKPVFARLIRKSIGRILSRWRCPPATISLENLVIK